MSKTAFAMFQMSFGIVATICSGLFAGAAAYVNLVEHPARMTCGTAAALAEWRPSYKRATAMQVPLAIAGTFSAFLAAITGPRRAGWLTGGALLGSVVPFTLIVILPTNDQLLDSTNARDPDEIRSLLSKWNRLHAVRSALSASAFLIFAVSLTPPSRDGRTGT